MTYTRIRWSAINTTVTNDEGTASKTLSGVARQAEIILKKDQTYQIVIDVSNEIGFNESLSLEPVVVAMDSASEY